MEIKEELERALSGGAGPGIARFALSCLSAVPVVGGAIGGASSAWSEREQQRFNKIFASWIKLQEDEIREIGVTIMEVMARLDQSDREIQRRIESPEYLKLIKKAFRDWSAAESEDKRILIRNLLANAAATKICSDDVVRMFIGWIDKYSEPHFAVIREIFNNDGITRQEIWEKIHGGIAREDSADADLFKLLFADLTIGHVVRQHREVDYQGNFIKQRPRKTTRMGSQFATSAFDDNKNYELTELGRQFVHYTMNEIVPRLQSENAKENEDKV